MTPPLLDLPHRTLSLPSGEIDLIDTGGSGSPILLLPGAPMTALAFARVIAPLRSHHRVIAPDLPGFGASTRGPAFAGDLEAHAGAIRELVCALALSDLTVYLNDSSACIGLVALQDEAARLRGLVVADTVPLPVPWAVRVILRLLSSRPARWINRTLGLLPWAVVTLAPLLRPFSRAERRALLSVWQPGQHDRILDIFAGMATDEAFMARAARAAARLRGVPALVLFGRLDPMCLVGGPAYWSGVFAQAERRIIPWEEHFPILGSGEQVGRIVRAWCAEVAP